MTRTALQINLLLFLLIGFFLNPQHTRAIGYTENGLPSFPDFYKSVITGEADVLRGVYVPDILALPVVQQPPNDPYYVSNRNGETTQFSIPSQYGNVGLLAHNNLSGRLFSKLAIGQEVRLVYEDGQVKYFEITQILQYMALEPNSIYTTFRDLKSDKNLTAGQLFSEIYEGDPRVVFQTCITANGVSTWGRLFVIAIPTSG